MRFHAHTSLEANFCNVRVKFRNKLQSGPNRVSGMSAKIPLCLVMSEVRNTLTGWDVSFVFHSMNKTQKAGSAVEIGLVWRPALCGCLPRPHTHSHTHTHPLAFN
jgi:hypothetical protein